MEEEQQQQQESGPLHEDLLYFSTLAMLFKTAVTANDVPVQYRAAFRLFHHRRLTLIKNKPAEGYFLINPITKREIKIDALTKELKTLFYPSGRVYSTGGGRTGGASRGNTVDREIEQLVNKGIAPPLPSQLHIFTTKTLRYLRDHGLQPFAAQMLVFDEKIHIATAVDIVCVDTTCTDFDRNVKVIELKTGFNDNYQAADGYFRSPFVADSSISTTTDSHKNRHQLQALVQHIIMAKNYGSIVRDTCVLVISEKLHSCYPLTPYIRRLAADVYATLKQRLKIEDPDYALNMRHQAEREDHAISKAKKLYTT